MRSRNKRGEGFPLVVLAATRVFGFSLSQNVLMLFPDLFSSTEIGCNPFVFEDVSSNFRFFTKQVPLSQKKILKTFANRCVISPTLLQVF